MTPDLDQKLDKACQELLTDPFSTNAANAGFLFAGLAAGGWAQQFGYRSMFLVCAVLSGLGLLMLYLQFRINVAVH